MAVGPSWKFKPTRQYRIVLRGSEPRSPQEHSFSASLFCLLECFGSSCFGSPWAQDVALDFPKKSRMSQDYPGIAMAPHCEPNLLARSIMQGSNETKPTSCEFTLISKLSVINGRAYRNWLYKLTKALVISANCSPTTLPTAHLTIFPSLHHTCLPKQITINFHHIIRPKRPCLESPRSHRSWPI